jgi:hypothetical protein
VSDEQRHAQLAEASHRQHVIADALAAFASPSRRWLVAEKTYLEQAIAETPEDEVIDRASLVSRLSSVERELAEWLDEGVQHAELVGELRGVLPDSRMFELKLEGTGQLVRGTVGPGVSDPAALQPLVHKLVRMPVLVVQVGAGRPRYVLAGEPALVVPTSGA